MKYGVVKEHLNIWQFQFSKLHNTKDEARDEAERLCRKERATFYVVELIEKCYLDETPLKWQVVN